MRIEVDNCDNANEITREDVEKFFSDMAAIDFISLIFEIKLRNIL